MNTLYTLLPTALLRRLLDRRHYQLANYPFSEEVGLMPVDSDGAPIDGGFDTTVGSVTEPERVCLLRALRWIGGHK